MNCARVVRSAGMSSATNRAVHSGVEAFSRLARMDVMSCSAIGISTMGTPDMAMPTTAIAPTCFQVKLGQRRETPPCPPAPPRPPAGDQSPPARV